MGGKRNLLLLFEFLCLTLGIKALYTPQMHVNSNEHTSESLMLGQQQYFLSVQTNFKAELEKNRKEISELKDMITDLRNALIGSGKLETEYSTTKPKLFDDKLSYKTLPQSCDTVQDGNGVYSLRSMEPGQPAFGAYCDRGCIVMQRRQDGSVNFNRNWTAYQTDFGNLSGEYWLGLNRIHALTEEREYSMRIEFKSLDGKPFSGTYDEFKVADEVDGYKLTVDKYHGNFGDVLNMNNGMKFSTYDKDNDLWALKGANCADIRRCAWWHNRCSFANFNGDYKPYTQKEVDSKYDNTGLWLIANSLFYSLS